MDGRERPEQPLSGPHCHDWYIMRVYALRHPNAMHKRMLQEDGALDAWDQRMIRVDKAIICENIVVQTQLCFPY
jgi:hypothetical protein